MDFFDILEESSQNGLLSLSDEKTIEIFEKEMQNVANSIEVLVFEE